MTLIIDSNEHRNHPGIAPLLQAQGVPTDVGNTNQSPGSTLIYPDFLIWEGLVGINRKTVGEWLSSTDKVIDQVQRELAGPINSLVLLIEGIMVADINGMWGYEINWERNTVFRRGLGQEIGTAPFSRRHYMVNAKHYQNEQTRLEFMGVQVVHTYSLQDTVSKLVSFHDMILEGKPNNVLSRLVKPELNVRGLTPQETAMAKTLMGITNGGVGEVAALTLAASFNNLMELIQYWQQGSTIQDTMMLGGTRRIGPALEKKLQKAIGYESPVLV